MLFRSQTPIPAYETLRGEAAVKATGMSVSGTQPLDFKGASYEIVSTFKPAEGTKKVGFNVRVGNGQKTAVVYDIENQQMYIDRTQSGKIGRSCTTTIPPTRRRTTGSWL